MKIDTSTAYRLNVKTACHRERERESARRERERAKEEEEEEEQACVGEMIYRGYSGLALPDHDYIVNKTTDRETFTISDGKKEDEMEYNKSRKKPLLREIRWSSYNIGKPNCE